MRRAHRCAAGASRRAASPRAMTRARPHAALCLALAALLCALPSFAPTAYAQAEGAAQGDQAGAAAPFDDVDASGPCASDAAHFCKKVTAGGGALSECLTNQLADEKVRPRRPPHRAPPPRSALARPNPSEGRMPRRRGGDPPREARPRAACSKHAPAKGQGGLLNFCHHPPCAPAPLKNSLVPCSPHRHPLSPNRPPQRAAHRPFPPQALTRPPVASASSLPLCRHRRARLRAGASPRTARRTCAPSRWSAPRALSR